MKRFITALLSVAALCFTLSTAFAEVGFKTVPLTVFTSKAASVNQAANDSGPNYGFANSLGAANTSDTTYAFGPVWPIAYAPDSLQRIIVGIRFSAAIASGESLYAVLQGSGDQGQSWTNLNVGGISIGGSLTGQVATGTILLASTATSATNVAAKSPIATTPFFYTGWYGWPYLRIIFISDKSGAMVANGYQAWVTFPSNF